MYEYKTQRERLFTDEGQRLFLLIRDHVRTLLAKAGAVRMHEATSVGGGDSWLKLACVDRLVELNEIREIGGAAAGIAGQNRVFVAEHS